MKARLRRHWEKLRDSFWFVPTVMAAGASALSFGAIRLDRAVSSQWVSELWWIYSSGPDGTREVLSVIAGSMITVTGVVFSITIVALSLASQQLGPRLLRNFMGDTGNQIVLGTFTSTYLYCLLILRTIYKEEDDSFVPHLSVAFAVLLALVSLGVLIYFIHHVAVSIQAPNVIAAVGHDLLATIDTSYPRSFGGQPPAGWSERDGAGLPESFQQEARPVEAKESGYIQAIDQDALLRVAAEHDLVMKVPRRPGCFVVKCQPLLLAWPADRVTDEVVDDVRFAFIVGRHRTATQDVEFSLDQLVEVALRALSPGVNDPFTAMNCIDWISAGLHDLVQRETPSPYRFDDEGRLRIVTDLSTFEGIADAAFDQLRQMAEGQVAVTCRLLEAISRVAEVCPDEQRRGVLLHHASLIHQGSQAFNEPKDRRDVAERYGRLLRQLRPGEDENAPSEPEKLPEREFR